MSIKTMFSWSFLLVILGGVVWIGMEILNRETYKISFETNGGSIVQDLSIGENEEISALPITSKEGYEFVGWYQDDLLFDLAMPINSDITLSAKWKMKEAPKYVVSFDVLGGEIINAIEVSENEKIDYVLEPSREGYQFEGWYYHNKEFDLVNTPIMNNITLVAKWSKITE
ncbi:MAG: InlB B-repeat-containing protein [Bacilli bacterium]|nr:InlB B-repeat-containing protein [Bacilli bacterium]